MKKRVRHPEYHQGRHNDLMVLLLVEKVASVEPRLLANRSTIGIAVQRTQRAFYDRKEFGAAWGRTIIGKEVSSIAGKKVVRLWD